MSSELGHAKASLLWDFSIEIPAGPDSDGSLGLECWGTILPSSVAVGLLVPKATIELGRGDRNGPS